MGGGASRPGRPGPGGEAASSGRPSPHRLVAGSPSGPRRGAPRGDAESGLDRDESLRGAPRRPRRKGLGSPRGQPHPHERGRHRRCEPRCGAGRGGRGTARPDRPRRGARPPLLCAGGSGCPRVLAARVSPRGLPSDVDAERSVGEGDRHGRPASPPADLVPGRGPRPPHRCGGAPPREHRSGARRPFSRAVEVLDRDGGDPVAGSRGLRSGSRRRALFATIPRFGHDSAVGLRRERSRHDLSDGRGADWFRRKCRAPSPHRENWGRTGGVRRSIGSGIAPRSRRHTRTTQPCFIPAPC